MRGPEAGVEVDPLVEVPHLHVAGLLLTQLVGELAQPLTDQHKCIVIIVITPITIIARAVNKRFHNIWYNTLTTYFSKHPISLCLNVSLAQSFIKCLLSL